MGNKNKKSTAALNRRWFANADGWGVSFQVGSGEPQKGKRSLPVSVGQKFFAQPVSVNGATHNTIYTFNPLSQLSQGVGSGQRIGDGIKLKGLSFRFLIDSVVTVPTVWRVMLVASTRQFAGANFGSGLGSTDVFFGNTYTVADHGDARRAKILCDTTYELKPRVSGQPDTRFEFVDCEVNAQYNYLTGQVYGEASNLYFVVTTYTPGGSSGTTVCGNINGEVVTSWAD